MCDIHPAKASQENYVWLRRKPPSGEYQNGYWLEGVKVSEQDLPSDLARGEHWEEKISHDGPVLDCIAPSVVSPRLDPSLAFVARTRCHWPVVLFRCCELLRD